RRRRELPLSRGIDPHAPGPGDPARHDGSRGLRALRLARPQRRHRRGAPRLQAMTERLLQSAFEWWLADSPEVRDGFAALAGKRIVVAATDVDVALTLAPHGDGVAVRVGAGAAHDVRIAGTTRDLLTLARGGAGARVTVDGDAELAQTVRGLLRQVRPVPDERAARVSGDVPAHPLGRLLRAAAAFGRGSALALADMAGEYWQHEARLLPTRAEVQAFVDGVDELRDAVER